MKIGSKGDVVVAAPGNIGDSFEVQNLSAGPITVQVGAQQTILLPGSPPAIFDQYTQRERPDGAALSEADRRAGQSMGPAGAPHTTGTVPGGLPPDAAASKPRSFIIARSLRDAVNSAEIDWKWRRVAEREFETPAGERVIYADSVNALRGRRPETRVYLGWKWYARRDAREIEYLRRHDLLVFLEDGK